MHSEEGEFWDRRYREEGAIWGDGPSPTAVRAAHYLRPGARVLEVGFGYGRDVAFLLRQGCHVSGVELSREGRRQTEARLDEAGLHADALWTGCFEDDGFGAGDFDALLSHRVIHLLLTREGIARFAARAGRTLAPGGLLCVAARNFHDLDPAAMVEVGDRVYEYRSRPGHRIRYWDEASFREAFGPSFDVLEMTETVEYESRARPVPCHLTVMIARKLPAAGRPEPTA